jgi:hypothetical protein
VKTLATTLTGTTLHSEAEVVGSDAVFSQAISVKETVGAVFGVTMKLREIMLWFPA